MRWKLRCGMTVLLVATAGFGWTVAQRNASPSSAVARWFSGWIGRCASSASDSTEDGGVRVVPLGELDLAGVLGENPDDAEFSRTLRMFDLDLMSREKPFSASAASEEECEEPPIAPEMPRVDEGVVWDAPSALVMPPCSEEETSVPVRMPRADGDDGKPVYHEAKKPAPEEGHLHFHRVHRLPYGVDPRTGEESPVHPEIDTMEFRPSDARRGELQTSPTRRPY